MKWCFRKDSLGNAIEAGFTTMKAGAGETIEQYDDVDQTIIAEIKVNTAPSKDKLTAMLALDASAESGALKAVIEFLQEKHG